MAQLADNNALLIYRVGPVLCASPTLPVEGLITPPALTHPPGSSTSHPGIFRHDNKLVRLTDLRQLFGVEQQDRNQPGRIMICQLDEKHSGFLVDQVIDVIKTPASGWGQLSPSLSGGVFSKSLLLDEKLHLYTEFEKLQRVRHAGFLKPWLEHLQHQAQQHEQAASQEPPPPHRSAHVSTAAHKQDALINTEATTKAVTASTDPSADSSLKSAQKDSIKEGKISHTHSATNGHHNTDASPTAMLHGDHESLATQKLAQPNTQSRTQKTPARPRSSTTPASPQTATFTRTYPRTNAEDTLSADRVATQKTVVDKTTMPPPKSTQTPDPLNSTNQTDSGSASGRITEDQHHSGLFTFGLLFIGLGLVTAFIYLWPSQDPQPDKISANKAPLISTMQEKPAPTMPEVEQPLPISSPVTDTLANSQTKVITDSTIDSQSHSADSTSETLTENTPPSPPTIPTNENVYHAAIKQQHTEPGNNEITIILHAPASDKVIRNEAVLAAAETALTPAPPDEEPAQPLRQQSPTAAQQVDAIVHTVVRGDTLWHIAQRYIHNPYRYPELARLNKIHNPDLIYPGDRVRIIRIYQNPTPAATAK